MLLENTLKELNPVIIVVNENLLIRIKYIKAWPGKIEISYFLFTICWNPLRAFKTSTADYMLAVEYSDILKDWAISQKPKIT